MKKILSMYFIMFCAFMLAACGKSEKHTIEILIPAGSTADFVYSDTEICPTGNKITISSGAGLGDTEVILKPVEVKQKTAYEPAYLTHGMPVKMDVEKGGWFKIGVSVQNDSNRGPIAVSVEVEGVEVRIAEKKDVIFNATVLEIHDGYYLVNPVEGSRELSSADKIEVSMKNLDPSLEPEVGDLIEITYDGMIMELYPAISQPEKICANSAAFSLKVGQSFTSSFVIPVTAEASGEMGMRGLKRRVCASSFPLGYTLMKQSSTMRSEEMLNPVDSMSKKMRGRVRLSFIP